MRGQWSAAQTHLSSARAASERSPLLLALATASAAFASSRGDLKGVLLATELLRASGLVGAGGRPGIFNWRAAEVDAFIGLGRLDEAAHALDEFETAIPLSGLPSAALMVERGRGNLAAAHRHGVDAETAFARAHLIAAGVAMPFEHAQLAFDDGRRLAAGGDRPAGRAGLEKAHRLFSDLGADPYVQACAKQLADLHVTAAPSSQGSLLGLSRAELAVARLVATGLSNREVASQLYVSVKTVEFHLRNSYVKLDISSRRALAALLR